MARVYATRAQLVGYAPPSVAIPEDPEATRILTRASEDIEDALLTAVYLVDSGGLPTDALVIQAFQDATCAQAVHRINTGADEGDEIGQWDSVSIGSVKLSGRKSSATTSGSTTRLSSEALGHLRRAGVVSGPINHL